MPVEIDESELETLRNAAKVLETINGEDRKTVEKAIKKLNPSYKSTDDIAADYTGPLLEKIEKISKWQEGMDNKVKDYNKQESFNRLRDQGFTSEGVEGIKKLMEERGISDPEVAAAYWEKLNPPEPSMPAGYSGDSFDFTGGESEENVKLLQTNPDKYEEKMVNNFLKEKQTKVRNGTWDPNNIS